MISYIVRRILLAIPILVVITFAAFALLRVAPGGPFDSDRPLPPEIRENLNAAYGLDQPFHIQFARYATGLLQGDFGPSYQYKDLQVSEIIADRLPVSVIIGGLTLIITSILGGALGVTAAMNQNSGFDYAITSGSVLFIATPTFVSAPILALIFGVTLDILPVAGWNGGALSNLILPVTALSIPYTAYIARLMRGAMLENLSADYIHAARARGVSEQRIILRHALPPALLPVVSYLGPAAAGILTGSVVIEQIFALPGAGEAFINAALNRDYTVVMGLVVCYAILITLINLLTDIVYGVLDPRLRVGA